MEFLWNFCVEGGAGDGAGSGAANFRAACRGLGSRPQSVILLKVVYEEEVRRMVSRRPREVSPWRPLYPARREGLTALLRRDA